MCRSRVPASDTDLTQALLDPALLDELHAFVWTEPFPDRGTPDDGWSSRDHVVVVGAQYTAVIERAMRATDELRATYHMQREDPYDDDIAGKGLSWANSRVSQRLRARGLPEDLSGRLATHLLGLHAGHRQPLRGISPSKARAIIAADVKLTDRP
jgi:hypothetical protein